MDWVIATRSWDRVIATWSWSGFRNRWCDEILDFLTKLKGEVRYRHHTKPPNPRNTSVLEIACLSTEQMYFPVLPSSIKLVIFKTSCSYHMPLLLCGSCLTHESAKSVVWLFPLLAKVVRKLLLWRQYDNVLPSKCLPDLSWAHRDINRGHNNKLVLSLLM